MRTKLVVSFVAVLALAGCGKGSGAGGSTAKLFEHMEAARTRACVCPDAACGEQVRAELQSWMAANPEQVAHARKLPKAEQDRFAALSREAQVCLDRLMPAPPPPLTGAPGDQPPPPPVPAPTPGTAGDSREPAPVPETPDTVEPPPAKPTPAMKDPTRT